LHILSLEAENIRGLAEFLERARPIDVAPFYRVILDFKEVDLMVLAALFLPKRIV